MKKLFYIAALAVAVSCCGTAQPKTEVIPPVMGWSSWNAYQTDINEAKIRSQADALVSLGYKDAGYNYINIDDGFYLYRDEDGVMHENLELFPSGMKGLADYIHNLGLKAGTYSDAGVNTCGSIFSGDPKGVGAGLYCHQQQDLDLYLNDWGYDFIKIDFCGGREQGLDVQRRYTEIYNSILATGRKDISLNICRWAYPGTWVEDLAASWRTTYDIRDRWSSIRDIIAENLYLSAFCRNGHYNDLDMLMVGHSLSELEEQTHFGMWCMLTSPLIIGCPLETVSPQLHALLTNPELIALDQDPLALQGYVAKRCEDNHYVLVKDIETLHGTTRAAAFYNPSDEQYSFSVDFSTLDLCGKVAVRDLMRREDIGTFEGSYCCTVPAHGVQIVSLSAQERLESKLYEAEWAYLPMYQELEPALEGVLRPIIGAREFEGASGGVLVTNIGGGKAENCIRWEDVYSLEGGEYDITVYYATSDAVLANEYHNPSWFEPSINGEALPKVAVEDLPKGEIATVTIPVTLQKGSNVFSLTNSYHWAPSVDKIELSKR